MSRSGAFNLIWFWLIKIKLWLFMKPFCYGTGAKGDYHFKYVGINLPVGWKFLHYSVDRTKGSFMVNLSLHKSVR